MDDNKFEEFAAVGDAKITGALVWEYYIPIFALICYFSEIWMVYSGLSVALVFRFLNFIAGRIRCKPGLCVILIVSAITLSCRYEDIFIGVDIALLAYSVLSYLITTVIMFKVFPGVRAGYAIIAIGLLSARFGITVLEWFALFSVAFTFFKSRVSVYALFCDVLGGLMAFGYISHLSAKGLVCTSVFDNIVVGVTMMLVTEIFYRTIYTREFLAWSAEN